MITFRILLTLTLLFSLRAEEQQEESPLQVTAAAESFYEGQGFELRVTALAKQPPEAPEVSASADFFIQFIGETMASQGESKLFLYRYRLIPTRDGVLPLPVVQIRIEAELHISEPEAIRVLSAISSDELKLEVAVDRTECFAGQALVLSCTWYSALPLGNIRALYISAPILSDPAWRVLIPESERGLSGKNTIGLPVEGQRIIARVRACTLDDKPFQAITFKRLLIPLRHGTISIPPVRLLCSHIQGRHKQAGAYPSYFDNDFFHAVDANQNYSRLSARSTPISLKVAPVPGEGRPVGFSGVLGPCALDLSVTEQRLTLGDPVEVILSLTNHPHPEALQLPPLTRIADFATDFIVPEEIGHGRISEGARVWRFLAVPRRTAVTQLPAVSLSIFDPDQQQYREIGSEPISIVVLPDGDRHALEIPGETAAARERNEAGLWHNLRPADAGWRAHGARLLLFLLPVWLLLPLLAFLLSRSPARLALLRKTDPEAARRATALKVLRLALKRLPSSERDCYLRQAVGTYFSAYFGGLPGALTCADIERGLQARGIIPGESLCGMLRQIYHDADIARFGPESRAAEPSLSITKLRSEFRRLDRQWSA